MSAEDVVVGWKAIDEAAGDYQLAKDFHDGEVEEYFSSRKVEELIAQTGQPYRFNFAQVPVKALAGRIELRSLGVPDDEEGTLLLKDIFNANDGEKFYPDAFYKALEYGDSYVMTLPYDAQDDVVGVADDEIVEVGWEKVMIEPCDARMIYDGKNPRRKLFFVRRFVDYREEANMRIHRVELHYSDRVEFWETDAGKTPDKPESWQPSQDDEPVIGGEIPVVHYRTAEPYGIPVHKNAYAPQLAINKMLITQLTTTEAAGWPQRYALSEEGGVLDQNNDGPNWDADENAANLSNTTPAQERRGGQGSNMRGGPGTMQMWTGVKEVGQFDAADATKSFMDPAFKYISMMSILTDTPLHDFEHTVIPPSGESRKVAERPATKRAQAMMRRFQATLREEWKYTLLVAGHAVNRVDVRWVPPYVAEDVTDWQAVQLRQLCGVPTDQTLVEAGYDDDQVHAWLDQTPEAMSLKERIAALVTVADAAQKLSTATSLSASGGLALAGADVIVNDILSRLAIQNVNPA